MTQLEAPARAWLEEQGFAVHDAQLWREALTHGSLGELRDYQRLEFLGDRVLGLVIAQWLYTNDQGTEGVLAQRQNALISRQTCAERARAAGLAPFIRLGKQAHGDGAADSANVLGDVMEALIGASFLESGLGPTRELVLRLWAPLLESPAGRAKHPKSALQEWAAQHRRKPPEYEVVEVTGPDHARRFTVRVWVNHVGEALGEAPAKQDAETEAARLFLERHV